MAETLLSFGVEKLWKLLVRESKRFQGVDEQFNGLKSDVDMLRCFLEDADAKKHTSTMVRNTIKEIKDIVFDAEDIIETFLLKEELGNASGIRNSVRKLSNVTVKRMGLAFDMKSIRKRISKVIRDMKLLGVQQVICNEGYPQSLQEIQREMQQTFSSSNDDHLVGLEKNVEILVGFLVKEDRSNQVVCITGMGGIGKTTLARQVFNHETIKKHFSGLAWVCVSQQFTRKSVWQTILRQLRPEYKVSEMTDDELQEKLVQVFEMQKALIVIDDIWREGDWDRIKDVFLPKKGWKILLTSRNEGVALHANPTCINFKPECLTFEESWNLFQRIAFPRKDTTECKVDDDMEEIGKKMIKHCGGLPLAIKVLGGLLAPQYTLRDWKRVYENIGSHIGGTSFDDKNISSVYHILYRSFEELPIYLKQCFLYLAHFPEDHLINMRTLPYYWAAEGIQRPRCYNGASIRDVGDGYIEELVKRNMIIAERDIHTSRFENCQLHDMMREVCLGKAEEENFVQIVDASTHQLLALTSSANCQLPCKSRRLVIHSWDDGYHIENSKLRSFMVLKPSKWKASELRFTRLQLMRVLDLFDAEFEGGKVPSTIGKLIHLRYLSLYWAKITHIPSSMRNLKKLIYLNLHVAPDLILSFKPNFLKEMRELSYLRLPKRLHDKVKLDLGNLVKLETLGEFSTKHGNVRDIQGMTRLKTLIIIFNGGCNVETISSSLSELKHLECLIVDERDETRTREFVLDCVHLRELTLCIYMPRLPDELRFPSRVTTITLENCHLEEDPMPILKKLLHLNYLYLNSFSFSGRRMVCSKGGFPQLQRLVLCGLDELEEWIVEEGSMPFLHTLDISECIKLRELPDGLRFVTSLEHMRVTKSKGEEWKMRSSEGQLPSCLTTISLGGCRLEEDPMQILEKLFHLKEVLLDSSSFSGRRMVCSRGGFPQLQKLELKGLYEWEAWKVEEDSMPLLHTLYISNCQKLEKWIVKKDSMPFLHHLQITVCEKLEVWRVEEGSMSFLHTLYVSNCNKLKDLRDKLRFITLKETNLQISGVDWKNRFSEGHLPSCLTSIRLIECYLAEDPMPILEKLLRLKAVTLWSSSFVSRKIVCSRSGFPQLQNLSFSFIEEWEEWIIEEGSMPLLRTLRIVGCKKLKELPDGLRFITSLKNLTLHSMERKWKKILSKGGEDYKIQHIPRVTCDGKNLLTTRRGV